MIHQQGLSSRLFGLVAEPLRRNTSFFVFMYVLGVVVSVVELPDKPDAKLYDNLWPELLLDLYVVCAMLALLPRNHPLAGADCYPLKRCEQDSFIMPALGCDDDVEALFARNHVDPNIRYTTIENFSAMSMVEQGLGVSVMNKLITEKRICDVAISPSTRRPASRWARHSTPGRTPRRP